MKFAVPILLLLLLLLCTLPACTPPAPRSARHVILISLDTTRADHFGFYGNPAIETPALDRLASESVVLDDFMTVVPTTLASHVSLFTGNYPHAHGTPRNGFVVHEDNEMLTEVLRGEGFTTAGFAGSFALNSRFRFTQGFEHWDESFERYAGLGGHLQNERPAESVTRAVIDWLESAGVPERLFLFVHYFDPHAPYEAPPPWETMYDPAGRDGTLDWMSIRRDGQLRAGSKNEYAERAALQYASEIVYMDHHIGKLLDALRERWILDEALLVVTSDHGENFWEHPEVFDHGWTTFQTTMRSVGILRLPGGARGGTRVAGPAATIDVLPTVLEFLGIPVPEGVDGRAIDLSGETPIPPDRARFGQATKPWEEVEVDPRWTNMLKARCVRSGSYKYVQVPYAGLESLYDLSRDPGEQNDLLATGGREVEVVTRRLRGLLENWAASARPLESSFDPSQGQETIERLKALGYLGGGG